MDKQRSNSSDVLPFAPFFLSVQGILFQSGDFCVAPANQASWTYAVMFRHLPIYSPYLRPIQEGKKGGRGQMRLLQAENRDLQIRYYPLTKNLATMLPEDPMGCTAWTKAVRDQRKFIQYSMIACRATRQERMSFTISSEI